MKRKATMKEIKNQYKNLYSVPYCGLRDLLQWFDPAAYTCGVYGWNTDVYQIDSNTAIVTGYRPFGKKIDHDTLKKYNEIGYQIRNQTANFEKRLELANTTIANLMKELEA